MSTQCRERLLDQESLDNECILCSSMESGGITPRFIELFPEASPTAQILLQNKDFFLVPDDSPIIQDHLLLVSRQHVLSCANFPLENLSGFFDLKRRVQEFFSSENPSAPATLFFEHGAARVEGIVARCGVCLGVDHAHMHAIPVTPSNKDSDLFQNLTSNIQKLLKLTPLEIFPDELFKHRDKPYLYLEENGKACIFLSSPEDAYVTPSQFIRRLIGIYFDLGNHWDLRHLHSEHRDLERERVAKTIGKFKKYLESYEQKATA